MRAAIIADTGPLYAAVDPDDQFHRRAREELRRLGREKRDVVIAHPTLLEAYTLMLYRMGRATAARWLEEAGTGARLLNPTIEDYRDATAIVMALRDQPITLFDATVAALSARLGFEVWTYDHHFDLMRSRVWR